VNRQPLVGRQDSPPPPRPPDRDVAFMVLFAPGRPARGEPGQPGIQVSAVRGPAVSLCLGRELTEVRRARAAAGKALTGWGLAGHAEVAQLIVSELVTNALRHGEGPVRVRLSCDGDHLHVDVHDDGPGRPVRRLVTSDDESGHGLELIDGLLQEHGGTRHVADDKAGDGKTVQVSISLAGAQ
jgi:hypothetical protein